MAQCLKELAGLAEEFYSNVLGGHHNLEQRFQKTMTADEGDLFAVLWDDLSRSIDTNRHESSVSHDDVGENALRHAVMAQPGHGLQLMEVFAGVLRRNFAAEELKKYIPQNASTEISGQFRKEGAHNLAAVFTH